MVKSETVRTLNSLQLPPAMKVVASLFPPGANQDVIRAVRAALPAAVPDDYFEFLARSDGGEVGFDEDDPAWFDCLQRYSSSEMMSLRSVFEELWPTFVVIGSDGGTQHLAYVMTAGEPWPLVMHLPGSGSTRVAATMTELAERYFRPVGEVIA